MTQFFIVMIIVGAVTAYFWGPSTAVKIGPRILDYWILAGLVVVLLSPVIQLIKWGLFLFRKITGNKKPAKGF